MAPLDQHSGNVSLTLSPEEASEIALLIEDLSSMYTIASQAEFLDAAAYHAHSLPPRLRRFILDFKRDEPLQGFCTVSGFSIDVRSLAPTPHHWSAAVNAVGTNNPSMYLVLVASLLGDIFGWATKQNGAIILEILPIAGDEDLQISSGSHTELVWHTEDSFQPNRCDYLVLICLRNPYSVATTISSIGEVQIVKNDLELLFSPNFTILPDASHYQNNNPHPPAIAGNSSKIFAGIESMSSEPKYNSVLFGRRERPYLRIDPAYAGQSRTKEADAALKRLTVGLADVMKPVTLLPGEILVVNNFMAVHGRRTFRPRFDGTDRWLKRLLVTNDIRKSRDIQIPGTRLLR